MNTRVARVPAVRKRRKAIRRRRLGAALVAAAVLGAGAAALIAPEAVKEITLPLKHEDIIRQQSDEKGLDAALVASVIYEESKFRDATSHAGARGLMQITPETASYIARKSGGTEFVQGDLATPQINISYGTWYLRYLLERYGGDELTAVAAYNAGEGNVDSWRRSAGGSLELADIKFPETREYVSGVLEHRRDYAENYAGELGL
ncbi:MAG: lytic transglycosylase domain-containing protein [Thermoleophilaceae bacterium]|nr:lytic transglycosylase domain-containing protein [Thermoleophilaceae bacterium]